MIYVAKLKTRKEMERTIQPGLLGWWHDVCPGQTLELRDATPEDIARCSLKPTSSRDPADYLCENFDRGSLVLREAIAVLTPWTEEQMDAEVRKAIHRLGADRFRSALGVMVVGALATKPPCTVCGTAYEKHGSYPTCASHPYTPDGNCQHVPGALCVGAECRNGCVRGRGVAGVPGTGGEQ